MLSIKKVFYCYNELFKLCIFIHIFLIDICIRSVNYKTIKYFIKSFKLIHKFILIKDSFLNILKIEIKKLKN